MPKKMHTFQIRVTRQMDTTATVSVESYADEKDTDALVLKILSMQAKKAVIDAVKAGKDIGTTVVRDYSDENFKNYTHAWVVGEDSEIPADMVIHRDQNPVLVAEKDLEEDPDDAAWLNAQLTPEELARAEQAAKGPKYDMDTLERIMRNWNDIEPRCKESVLLLLNKSVIIHGHMIVDAATTPIGPLTVAIERHEAMVLAFTTAMKFLAGKDLLDTTEWLVTDPARREFVIEQLLGFYANTREHYKYSMEQGLTHGAQRYDDIAEAAYVAAIALGWVNPQVIKDQVMRQTTKNGSWDILDKVGNLAAHVFTATWTPLGEPPVSEGTEPKSDKKPKKAKKK